MSSHPVNSDNMKCCSRLVTSCKIVLMSTQVLCFSRHAKFKLIKLKRHMSSIVHGDSTRYGDICHPQHAVERQAVATYVAQSMLKVKHYSVHQQIRYVGLSSFGINSNMFTCSYNILFCQTPVLKNYGMTRTLRIKLPHISSQSHMCYSTPTLTDEIVL